MKLNFAGERVLAVVAHPDDVEMLCAGTLARARGDGATIGVCTLCQGDKGGKCESSEELSEVRRAEFHKSAEMLGADVFFGDVPDGQLVNDAFCREVTVGIFRQFCPTLVIAHAPEDYHADHRAASALAEAASWFAASPGDGGTPSLKQPPALIWMDTVNMLKFEPGFFVDVTQYQALKRQMLDCHQSQLRRSVEPGFDKLHDVMSRQTEARGAQAGVDAAEAFRIHLAWKRVKAW